MMKTLMNCLKVFLALYCFILLGLGSYAKAEFVCAGSSRDENFECYRGVKSDSNSSSCQHKNAICVAGVDKTAWTMIDSASGLFEVSFPLSSPGCNIQEYKLALQVLASDVASREECESLSPLSPLIHSRRNYIIKDQTCDAADNCSVCAENGSVRFQFVFSGCYQLEIRTIDTHSPAKSCPIFLESNYSKAPMSVTDPIFDPRLEIKGPDSKMHLEVKFAPLECSRVKVQLRLMQEVESMKTSACTKTGKYHSDFWCTIGHEERTCSVESNEPDSPFAHCKIDGDKVSCLFDKISHGNYCAILKILDDDRCEERTLWVPKAVNNCLWAREIGAEAASLDPMDVIPSHSYAIVGGIVVVALTFALLGVWIKFKQLRVRRMDRNDDTLGSLGSSRGDAGALNPSALNPGARCGILLLYSRDCEPFMHLMQTFRQLLEDVVKLEVYDCFDAQRWDQVSRSPSEWVRRLAQHPEVKVIAVASSCASKRLEAQLTGNRLHYAQPSCMDDLFVYAIQLLGDNVVQRNNSYQKMFVVRFDGFSDDLDLFTHLNSYTRYVLPAHLDLLVNSLQASSPDQSFHLIEQDQVQTIRHDLKKLVRFKTENEHYLEDNLLVRKCS